MKGRKTGGRKAGTPNKVSSRVKEQITDMVEGYFSSDQFNKDLAVLSAKDRLFIIEKFSAYVAPKLQSASVDINGEGGITIEDKLEELSFEEEDSESK